MENQVHSKDFFISYSKADLVWAEWIAWQLEEAGYSTILQAWDFRPGSNFVLDMNEAAEKASRTIAILSPHYLEAQYAQPEWAAALGPDPTGEETRLIPIRVEQCELKGLLQQIVYIDLVALNEHEAKSQLLRGVLPKRAKPVQTPAFPAIRQQALINKQPRFPGSLPSIWKVPNRNLNFTGREASLSSLHDYLKENRYSVVTQAISGLGGIGKTQIAIEYAYRFVKDYEIVWWMRAEEPAMLAADYARLAWKLELPEKELADQELIVEAVRSYLGQHKKWLLIFDNAADSSDLRDYLPQGGEGHILITSRNQNWRGTARPLSLSVLSRTEAVAFILKRTGQSEDSYASLLAEALGDLPLALEQAGAFIEATGTSIHQYLELFTRNKTELLRRGKPSTDYPATVATTWEMAFGQIQRDSTGGADLLNLCAFLAPDEIPRRIFYEACHVLAGSLAQAARDRFVLDQAFEALRRYSLAEVSSESVSIHRLVQAVTQDRLPQDAKNVTAEAALKLVNETFPAESDDVRTWPICKSLLSHALVVTRHAEDLKLPSPITGRLLNQIGLYLRGRAEFSEAQKIFEKALIIDETTHGLLHPTVAIRLNNLGELLETLGDLHSARESYERALTINAGHYGINHPTVASNINNLGNVFKKLADSTAIFLQEDSVVVRGLLDSTGDGSRETRFGPRYGPLAPKVVASQLGIRQELLESSSAVRRAVEHLSDAQKCFDRAIAINRQTLGPNHPSVANNLNNLGNVLVALCDPRRAQICFEQALQISESFYGMDHPIVATISNSLGSVLKKLGDLEGARRQYQRALEIDLVSYGARHPLVALRLNNIGRVWYELGDVEKARMLYTEALDIFQAVLGDKHPYTLTVQDNLRSLG